MKPIWLLLLLGAGCAGARTAPSEAREALAGIDAFNRALRDATTAMNPDASMALWADDGVSLLPATKPMVGKKAIDDFLRAVMLQLAGAKMTSFELRCFDIEASGDLATEWCTEHQVVDLGPGKEPFDGYGKMLLMLRRSPGGRWLLIREMWNQGERSTG